MRTVLVTGSTGFIGANLIRTLVETGRYRVRAAARTEKACYPEGVETVWIGDIGPDLDWSDALAGVDVVVHAAARIHVTKEEGANPLPVFRTVNVDGTKRLAEHAAAAGVRRFVFLSTIKVNGEYTVERPFQPEDVAAPQDAYAISKWTAEERLREIGMRTGLEVCIIRPPLVYGPGVKGNFRELMSLIERGVPLPFGAVRNRRSLTNVHNLCDLIVRCMEHPAAAGQTFLVSDGEDVSIAELVGRLGRAMGRPARLLPVPPFILRWGFSLLGRRADYDRLCGSLQVDIEGTCRRLDWLPPVSLDEGLAETVRWYKAERHTVS